MNPLISVNVLGFNSKKYLKDCFETLSLQTYKNLEISFIDNSSSDGSVDFLRTIFPNVNIIENDSNLGYAGGHNVGVKESRGDFILIMNPDVILSNNFIDNLFKCIQKDKKIGAISGKVFRWDFKNNHRTKIIDTAGLKIYKNHRVTERGGGMTKDHFNKSEEVFGLSGAVTLFRREALADVAYKNEVWDERFINYKEDIDLCFRLRIRGWKIYYLPEAISWHDRWETGSDEHEKVRKTISKRKIKSWAINYHSYRNHLLWVAKDEFCVNLLIYSPWILWYELKKFFYLLLYDKKTLQGAYDFIRNTPLTLSKRYDILKCRKIKARDIRKWIN